MINLHERLAMWRKFSWVRAVDAPGSVDGWQWFSVAVIKGGLVERPVWLLGKGE